MTINIECTLYHASWCIHCKNFIPEWDKFANKVKSMGGKWKDINITTNRFEEGSLKGEATIKGKPISGYPTVKIAIKSNNGRDVEYEYNGGRKADSLFTHVTEDAIRNLE